ncbi:MAG: hypothetical protein JW751_04725 [Polyangiaceae bacterium]|nr:hypothetical protein [Polyangiaceae bacterium]
MAGIVELNLNPDVRLLRQFGFIALAAFGLLAVCAWFEVLLFASGLGAARTATAVALLTAGVISTLFSLVYPRANRPAYVLLSVVAFPIGFVLSYLVMGILFFVVITPVGLLLRAVGEDPMRRRLHGPQKSYYVKARPTRPRLTYFRQF